MPFSFRAVALAVATVVAGPLAATAQVVAPPTGFAVSSWAIADGLPQSNVSGLARDREGYLWVGTAAGLARFDGDSFIAYPRDAEPGTVSGVRALATDRAGTIWVAGTDSVIGTLDSAGRLHAATARLPAPPLHIALGGGDTVWMTHVGALWLHAQRQWHRLDLPGSGFGQINALLPDSNGTVWLGGSTGLFRVTGPGWRPERIAGLPCTEVRALVPAGGGDLWVGTCRGLVRLSAQGTVRNLVLDRPFTTVVSALLAQGDEILWVGDQHGAHRLRVRKVSPARWDGRTTFTDPLQLEGALPSVMLATTDGGVWVGTAGAGLRWIRPRAVGRISNRDGLPVRPMHHIAPDGQGGLWLGGSCGGLVRWREGSVRVYRPPALGLRSNCVRGLLRDRAGSLWIGEVGRLARLDSAGRSRIVIQGGDFEDRDVAPMLEDRAGRVWFASASGLLGFVAGEEAPVVLPATTLPPFKVWSLAQDSSGGIWVGQEGVVSHLVDGRVVARLSRAEGVPSGPVRALQFDADGHLWLASYGGGLARYSPENGVRRLPRRGRPFEQALSAIVIDGADRLWLLGDGGLTVMPRAAAAAAIDVQQPAEGVTAFGPADGVPEGNGGFPNVWLDRVAKRLWAATVDGVVTVDLSRSRFPLDTVAPRIRLDDIRIDGASVAVTDALVIPPSASALQIRFTAPSFGGRDALQFRYRLRGHDRDWIVTGSGRVARYGNLAPGRYTFEVQALGRDLFGRGATRALAVRVEPFWWETTWARLVALLLTFLAVWLVFQRQMRRLRERASVLQHQIDGREKAESRAAAAARDLAHVRRLSTAGELATSIAHELNQPLTAVVGSAQTARHLLNGQDQEGLGALLDTIVAQSDRAADVIRALRAFVSKQPRATELVPVSGIVADTLRLLHPELRSREVTVEVVDEPGEPCRVRGDVVQLQQVLVNLVLNAASAMSHLPPEKRRVALLLRREGDQVQVSVADSGTGLSPELLARVFEPFFTTKPHGLGLGLSLSRSIVEAHSGRLWAESSEGWGSTFHLLLPVSES
jgi:signal transduction histidine kinase/ligand-binding sensor domain-containing protein